MRQDYERLFRSLSKNEPPRQLYGSILAHIGLEQRRQARIRCMFLGTTALVSCVALIPAFQYMVQEFYQSSFYQYLSILLSDGASVIPYWKEFTLLLAESTPLFGLTIVLSTIFIFLGSLKLIAKNMKIAFIRVPLTS